jgi:hypothetical protein
MSDMNNDNRSAIGRLLEEISWEGARVRGYRQGGRGLENVLTTEVFMLLDFLPRDLFLGPVIAAATGADSVRERIASEAEDADVQLLPGDITLRPAGIKVQPDATVTTSSCSVLVEAKRIKSSAFQSEQLAREYLALLQECNARKPLLLLVLGGPPPVSIRGQGRVSPHEAIANQLPILLDRLGKEPEEAIALTDVLPERLAWITWAQISKVVENAKPPESSTGVTASVHRMAHALLQAIEWHS